MHPDKFAEASRHVAGGDFTSPSGYARLAGITSITNTVAHGRGMPMPVPHIIEDSPRGPRGFDPYSKLLTARIVFLGSQVDEHSSNLICSLLMCLDNSGDDPAHLYIASPGGIVSGGMMIYDTMQAMNCEVHTYCAGTAASMGAVLFAAGTPGKRFILPHGTVMMHQPLGGAQGQASDVEIQAAEIRYAKRMITEVLAKHTGKTFDEISKDIDRDFYLHGEDAVKYNVADKMLHKLPKGQRLGISRGGGGSDE